MEAESSQSSMIKVFCLGAGQDVGRSCVCVTLSDRTIMFDVGIHMLYNDQRRYPDFSQLYSSPQTINDAVDLVIVTHFHLDHCGALPYLTQHHGYNGPIITSTPTKALIPIMLEDFRKVMEFGKKQEQFYSFGVAQVRNASAKVRSIGLFQTTTVNSIKVTSYYAGHVLGACMFHVEYNGYSAVYTGDYNSYADRHLGAASAPRLAPNILITETTYATTIRDTKRDRERAMLQLITETVERGGKVLIPVFALGRAQELAVLLETYWKRTDSNIPIYFSAGLIEKANLYYRLFADWQNEKIQEQFSRGDNVFEFKKVKAFDKSLIRADTPYVLFATPGMLHSGTSVQVFKQWCGDERNTLIIPGYCVEGTLGNKLLKGAKEVQIDKKSYEVKMRIENVSFSAHADAKGIINLIRNIDPEEIVFVHGDRMKMEIFKPLVEKQLNKRVRMPPNLVAEYIPASQRLTLKLNHSPLITEGFLQRTNAGQYCLLQEQEMLQQVNRIIELTGQNAVVLKEGIECCLSLKEELPLTLKSKYIDRLTFGSEVVKNEINSEEMIKQEQALSNFKVEGELRTVVQFLKDAKLVKAKQCH